MVIDNKIKDGKLQYNISREAAKIPALSLSKIDKYFTKEEILRSDQSQMIERSKFTFSPLGREFEKQQKIIEDQEKNIDYALHYLNSNQQLKLIEDFYF